MNELDHPKYRSRFLSHVITAATWLGCDMRYLDRVNGRLLEISKSGRSTVFGAKPCSHWPLNRSMPSSVSADKELTIRILADHEIVTPWTVFCESSKASDISAATAELPDDALTSTLVVKPNRGHGGTGVCFVHEPTSLERAVKIADKTPGGVIIQPCLAGLDQRIYLLDGKPILVLERTPFRLVGDGTLSWRDFIDRATSVPSGEAWEISVESYEKRHGDFVPGDGEPIDIYPVTNMQFASNRKIMPAEQMHKLDPLAARINAAMDLRFSAIDLIQADETIVLEVNCNPGIEAVFEVSETACRDLLAKLISAALEGEEESCY